MRRKLESTAALLALAAASGVTSAHATEGWYARADVGYSFNSYWDIDGSKVGAEEDWLGLAGVGYAFPNVRVEGELGYRTNDGTTSGSAGDQKVYSGMINAFYDFNRAGKFQPYIGAGAGYADMKFNDPAPSVSEDGGFAYQAMAGVGVALTKQLTLDVGYRYFRTSEHDYTEGATTGKIRYVANNVTAGLRWQFAAPAEAAPPSPPTPPVEAPPPRQVCPAQDFKVYFEWDRSALNAAGTETINAAAARAKACQVELIHVVGYTDTSGSAKYNIGLSNRRAGVVTDALVAAGIPAASIASEGAGETNLDKATKDGVREPLNRRTAVTISFN